MNQLDKIISQPYSDIKSNVLIELEVPDTIQFKKQSSLIIENRFFYPAIAANGYPNNDNFLQLLNGSIRRFSLSAKELDEHKKFTNDGDDMRAEAISNIGRRRFVKYAKGAGKNSGEIGELALFIILEAFFSAPKILSKMRIKTNNEVHVHGADAIHALLNEEEILTLIIGEAKFRNSRSNCLNDALLSLRGFINSYLKVDKEIELIESNINHDILDPALRGKLLKYFGNFTPESNQLQKTIAVFLGYDRSSLYKDLDIIETPEDRIAELNKRYLKHASEAADEFLKLLSEENNPQFYQVKFIYALLPFSDLNYLKEQFYELAGLQK